MSVGKKMLFVAIILGATIASYLFMFAIMPLIRTSANVASSAPSASNFTAYQSAMESSPWWLLVIPGAVGVITSVMVLRSKESR
jgi:hypothetical protein